MSIDDLLKGTATMPNGYTHTFRTMDGPRTVDRQLGILILNAYYTWEAFNKFYDELIAGYDALPDPVKTKLRELKVTVNALREACKEGEILLSGVASCK